MDAREKVNDIESSISRLLLSQRRPTPRLSNKAEQEEHHAKEQANGRGNSFNRMAGRSWGRTRWKQSPESLDWPARDGGELERCLPCPAILLSWHYGLLASPVGIFRKSQLSKTFCMPSQYKTLPPTWNIIHTLTPKFPGPRVPQLTSFSKLSASCPLFPTLTAATLLPRLIQPPGLFTDASPLPGGLTPSDAPLSCWQFYPQCRAHSRSSVSVFRING